jgi:multiple sugar transport system substrate-binding protein
MKGETRTILKLSRVLAAAVLLSACAAPVAPATPVVREVEVTREVIREVVATPTPAAAKPFEGRSINVLTIQPHAVATRALARWFEEETGARVQVLVVPYANVTEKAILDVTSGAGEYDVIEIWYPMLGNLVESGVLEDLTQWWEENREALQFDDFVPSIAEPYTLINGRRWALPYDGDTHLLFYNREILDRFGVKPPTTWAEYREVCKTITEQGKSEGIYGCAIMGAKAPIILLSTFVNRLQGYGAAFFDQNGKPAINSPEAVAALEELVNQLPYALPDPKAVAFDEALAGFTTGKVGMMEFWTDLGQMSDNPEQSKIMGKWGAVPMPKGEGPNAASRPALNAGFALGISTLAQNKPLAYEFLKFVGRPDINVRVNTIVGGLDPTRKSTFDAEAYRKHVTPELADAAKAALSGAFAWPTNAKWPELQDILTENVAEALAGTKTPKQALDDTQAKWLEILGR